MTLAELQRAVFAWVADGATPEGAAALVHGGALTPEERVGVYAEMYWLRMRDVLRDDFALTRAVLGDEDFEVLVARYVRAFPSQHPSLGELGRSLPAFLREHPIAGAEWLGELAALERARTEAFVAPDAPVLEVGALAALDGEGFVTAQLRPVPSLRVLELTHDVLPAWRALSRSESASAPDARSTWVVVWRRGFEVFHVEVPAAEALALKAVRAGEVLPIVCEAFAEADEPAQAAFTAIASWVGEGMIAALAR